MKIQNKASLKFLRKASFVLSTATQITSTIISVAYLIFTFNAALGLVFALLITVANNIINTLVSYNTTMEHPAQPSANNPEENPKPNIIENTPTTLLAWLITPCLALQSLSTFISTYSSLSLLLAAFPLIAPVLALGLAITAASLVTISALLYNIIQMHEVFERLETAPSAKIWPNSMTNSMIGEIAILPQFDKASKTTELPILISQQTNEISVIPQNS